MSYLKQGFGTRSTPQSEPIPGSAQVANSAGGYSFQLDDWGRLERWLVLGSAGGTYYIGQRELTLENAQALMRCLEQDAPRAIETIAGISEQGRALRNEEAIFALAVAAGYQRNGEPVVEIRQRALAVLPRVCRIPTHLFMFVDFVEQFRGWGRGLRRAIAKAYAEKPVEQLAYHLVKYRQRGGWEHKDLLRLAHPGRKVSSGNPEVEVDPPHEALLRWAAGKRPDGELSQHVLPDAIIAYEAAQVAQTPKDTVKLIEQYGSALPREALKTEHLSDVGVNAALLDAGMPMTALIRNLGNLTRHGVLKPLDSRTEQVCKQIANPEAIRKARVHPLAILFALATYKSGQGFRGGNSWSPVSDIIGALDEAFYMAFDTVEPAGKRFMLALDVSASMSARIADSMLSCMEAAVAMAMVTHRTEPRTYAMTFDTGFRELPITSTQRLDDVMNSLPRNFGGTDCALPMLHAMEKELAVDCFCVYTDSETYWNPRIHPCQALQQYREKMGIPAKLVVVGMTANAFSIADEADQGMIDVVGFDTTVPPVISDFARA